MPKTEALWSGVRWLMAVAVLGVLSCAKMGAPPGGPEDKTGPFVVDYFPEPDAVNVDRQMTAHLVFSEPVNRASVESSLFMSPDPGQRLRYRWKGRTLEFVYLDELDLNQTYVITVGSQAKDLRGNPIDQPFTIAFSTGPKIDRGRVHGWVTGEDAPQAISIWAHAMSYDSAIDLYGTVPDYRIQPDATGSFTMAYMRAGRYRLFAVEDRDHDGLWNPSSERIGLPPWDVTVTDSTESWVSFKLANQDTSPPAIRSAQCITSRAVEVRTTVPVSSLKGDFVSEHNDTLRVLDEYRDPDEEDIWRVFPVSELSPGQWTLIADGKSLLGIDWSSAESLTVRQIDDTTRPTLLRSEPPVKGRSREILSSFRLEFVEPVTIDSRRLFESYLFSPRRDSLRAMVQNTAPRVVEVRTDTVFTPGNYVFRFDGTAIQDLSGNAFGDSTSELRFGFYSPDSLGSLLINLVAASGEYIADIYSARDHELVQQSPDHEAGPISFAHLPPGPYTFEIIRDRNADGQYDLGRVHPWHYSEPYIVPIDTATIRARWEQEVKVAWPENP